MKTKDLIYIALSSALIVICSWISIPSAVPFTLQTFAVMLTAGLFGMKRGTASVLLYILLGAVGLPVFSGFKGGVGALLGTTGGYITGFIFTALIVGFVSDKFNKKTLPLLISMIIGIAVCYAFGTAWFMNVYAKKTGAVGLTTVLSWCIFPFIIPDMVKIALATFFVKRLEKVIK